MSDFKFLFLFSMKFLLTNIIVPDGNSAASYLVLYRLPMCYKYDYLINQGLYN